MIIPISYKRDNKEQQKPVRTNLISLTPKQKRDYEKAKKKEEKAKRRTLFWTKLLKKKIDKDDTRTIQEHKSAGGGVDYYIADPYLQQEESFSSVVTVIEDEKNSRFIYKGISSGADNAIGVIESNVPLTEIVASPYGNEALLEMLSRENAMNACLEYYRKNGLSEEKLKGHYTHWASPTFVLGTITRDSNGKYSFNRDISSDIEKGLIEEREELAKKEKLRDESAIIVHAGKDLVIAEQTCWLVHGKMGVEYAGINPEALCYVYAPGKPIQTEDGKYYVFIGGLQLGESKIANPQENNGQLEFIQPYIYDDVVVWTEGKKLIQYYFEKNSNEVYVPLGEIFTTYNLEENKQKNEVDEAKSSGEQEMFAGGIRLNENGKCEKSEEVPETVKKAIIEYLKSKEIGNEGKIVKFER